jgi:N-dimethylarginine dimethylaminohydrolase
MGQLRLVDRDLAVAWPGRAPFRAVSQLHSRGFRVEVLPDEAEARGQALNFVVLGPRRVLAPAGHPVTRRFLEDLGVECTVVEINELARAAGGIGCLTGVLHRG